MLRNLNPDITVIIITWNRKEELLRCIESVKNQSFSSFEILVIDNASTDGTVAAVQKYHPDVSLKVLDNNLGCVNARNFAMRFVTSEYVFFTDDDGMLHFRALEIAYKTIKYDTRIGVVGGSVKYFNHHSEADLGCKLLNNHQNRISVHFHGGVCIHRVSMYAFTGLYPKNYFYGGEEDYLTMRMIKERFYVVENNSIILWHPKQSKGRNQAKELVNRQVNSLSNRVSFWPFEFVFIYAAKCILRHPSQALVRGIFLSWLQYYFSTLFRQLRTATNKRNPISRGALQQYYAIKKTNYCNIEETQNKKYHYLSCLLSELLES